MSFMATKFGKLARNNSSLARLDSSAGRLMTRCVYGETYLPSNKGIMKAFTRPVTFTLSSYPMPIRKHNDVAIRSWESFI